MTAFAAQRVDAGLRAVRHRIRKASYLRRWVVLGAGIGVVSGIGGISGIILFDEVQAKIRAKYGRWQIRIIPWISRLQGRLKADQTFGDTVVLITVAENSRQTA